MGYAVLRLTTKRMRPKFSKTARTEILAKTGGRCHHCETELGDVWDVDHFPVRFADIEDQAPCCGVTDPYDMDNLVPSCRSCNRSHAHERTKWCGHSQIRCRQSYMLKCVLLAAACAIGYMCGVYIR